MFILDFVPSGMFFKATFNCFVFLIHTSISMPGIEQFTTLFAASSDKLTLALDDKAFGKKISTIRREWWEVTTKVRVSFDFLSWRKLMCLNNWTVSYLSLMSS